MKHNAIEVKNPIVDGLAFILSWGTFNDDYQRSVTPISKRIKKATDDGVIERKFFRGSRYRESFNIQLSGDEPVLVQIGAIQPNSQKGGIRVELNPAKFQPGDVDFFHETMKRIIGKRYLSLMENPSVNVIHCAVDIVGANLDRTLVAYTNAQRYTIFGKRFDAQAHIEGYNFGSVSSDYMTAVYEKDVERVHRALLRLLKQKRETDPLKSNVVKQFLNNKSGQQELRVEVRGKKLRGLPLYKISDLTNRFERFAFCDLFSDGTELPSYIEESFLALCRQNGVKAALETFKHTEWVRKVNAYYRSRNATWWHPDDMWKQACDSLRGTGLFPDSAFVEPKYRVHDDSDRPFK